MARSSRGPSLLQARDAHSHSHSLFHRLRHGAARNDDTPKSHHDRHARHAADDASDGNADAGRQLDRRVDDSGVAVDDVQGTDTSLITRVVQTVSLVQVVDPWGSAFETRTIVGPPGTEVIDSSSGNTVAISALDVAPTLAVPAPGAASRSSASDSSASDSSATAPPPALTTPPSQAPGLTSAPLSSLAIYPTLSDVRNGTNSVYHGNSSFIPTNSTLFRVSALSASAETSDTDTASLSTSPTTTKFVHSTSSSTSEYTSTYATSAGFDGGPVASTAAEGAQPTQTSNPDTGGANLSTQQKAVIGGVVGGIAGVAFVALLVLLALKYKRRRDARLLLGGGQSGTTASRSIIGDGGSGGGGSGAMAERSGPSAVAAALASLTGKGKRTAPATPGSAEGGERGFYRVSGRKLPSVLHAGGDGYSDPRESSLSGGSDYYRGSQAFDPSDAAVGQLALGRPMRPVSGIPIMRSGPGRTPVTENPFADPQSPPDGHDQSRRALGSRDSPRGSASRFQEGI